MTKNLEHDTSVDGIKCLLEVNRSDDERKLIAAKGFDDPWQDVDLLRAISTRMESGLVLL